MASSVDVLTFGCRLNFYESEVIRGIVPGVLDCEEGKRFVVVNTCAVTNEAERQVLQKLRSLNRNDPELGIIVVGCAAQLSPDKYINMPGVVKVLGNSDKLFAENYRISNVDMGAIGSKSASANSPLIKHFSGKTRAFLAIQNGCNHECTFCSITHARGNSKSVSVGHIMEQIGIFLDQGYQEVVLTGVNITSFGLDLQDNTLSLAVLLRLILDEFPDLMRLRLSSVDVADFGPELVRVFRDYDRIMPHVHLSLQSGNDVILKRMKRRHLRQDVYELCSTMRDCIQGVSFGADIIVGFPTETEAWFQDTVELIRDCNISFLHVFPYSRKSDTVAARMPQLLDHVKKNRSKIMLDLSRGQLSLLHDEMLGTRQKILFESKNLGRAENFVLVALEDDSSNSKLKGIHEVVITGVSADRAHLLCKLV